MRALSLAVLTLLVAQPALGQSELPEGVEHLLTCATAYSLKSDEAKEAGDEGGATEFVTRGDALTWQARSTMEGAGMAHKFTSTGETPLRMVCIHVSPIFSTEWLEPPPSN